MNPDQEVQDLRQKYTALDILCKHLQDRIRSLEETLNKVGALGLAHEKRVQGLEQDFDNAAGKRIASNRNLQDQIDHLRAPQTSAA